jgi:hypothetical protein
MSSDVPPCGLAQKPYCLTQKPYGLTQKEVDS